jgi:hypothetical protein
VLFQVKAGLPAAAGGGSMCESGRIRRSVDAGTAIVGPTRLVFGGALRKASPV